MICEITKMAYKYIQYLTLDHKIKKGGSAGLAEYMENIKYVYRILEVDMK
jgi:hypothetical protein